MKKRFRPRQKIAIDYPIKSKRELATRYYRRIGYIQSILTFDLFPSEGIPGQFLERAVDDQVGVWHGRVAQFPSKPLKKWGDEAFDDACAIARRLVMRVGIKPDEVAPGADEASVHVFKWATLPEVMHALRAVAKENK